MKTRKPRTPRKPQPPQYTYERTTHDGIAERLELTSLWKSETKPSFSTKGAYFHQAWFISKKEGWSSRYTWIDNLDHVDLQFDGRIRAFIAHGIEGARLAWWHTQHPDKELLAIVEAAQAKAAARLALKGAA